MTEVARQPMDGGYVHPALQALEEYKALTADQPLPMRRAEYLDQCKRDVGASADQPIAEVYPQEKNDIVHFRMDSRTAAVVMRAVHLMLADTELQMQDVRRVADRFPPDTYGRANRVEIALRKERVAGRLRVLDSAYRDAVDKAWWDI